jgi:hypothetical protein
MKTRVSFKNLPPQVILEILKDGLILQLSGEVKCNSIEKLKEFQSIGILAELVEIYNVMVVDEIFLEITANSGIRRKYEEKISLPPPKTKWICLICNYHNFPSVTVCFCCDKARTEGPLWIASRPEKIYPTWTCHSCYAKMHFHQSYRCWKCLRKQK